MYVLQSFPEDFGVPQSGEMNKHPTRREPEQMDARDTEDLVRLCPTLGGKSFLMTMKMIHPSCCYYLSEAFLQMCIQILKRDTMFARFPLSEKNRGKAWTKKKSNLANKGQTISFYQSVRSKCLFTPPMNHPFG